MRLKIVEPRIVPKNNAPKNGPKIYPEIDPKVLAQRGVLKFPKMD